MLRMSISFYFEQIPQLIRFSITQFSMKGAIVFAPGDHTIYPFWLLISSYYWYNNMHSFYKGDKNH